MARSATVPCRRSAEGRSRAGGVGDPGRVVGQALVARVRVARSGPGRAAPDDRGIGAQDARDGAAAEDRHAHGAPTDPLVHRQGAGRPVPDEPHLRNVAGLKGARQRRGEVHGEGDRSGWVAEGGLVAFCTASEARFGEEVWPTTAKTRARTASIARSATGIRLRRGTGTTLPLALGPARHSAPRAVPPRAAPPRPQPPRAARPDLSRRRPGDGAARSALPEPSKGS